MASINKVILIGNLGKDPEVRYMPSGSAICNITVATSRQWKNKESGDPHRPSSLVPHAATRGAAPRPQVDPLQGGGERDRIGNHQQAAEQSGGGSRLVRRREGLLHGREGFAADAEPGGDGIHDGATGSRW